MVDFSGAILNRNIIGHLLLSLMFGVKTAAYYVYKTTTNKVFSISVSKTKDN